MYVYKSKCDESQHFYKFTELHYLNRKSQIIAVFVSPFDLRAIGGSVVVLGEIVEGGVAGVG